MAKYFEGLIKIKDEEPYVVKFWSQYPANTKKNYEDAGRSYMERFPDFKGTLMVMNTRHLNYSQIDWEWEKKRKSIKNNSNDLPFRIFPETL